MQLPLLLKVFLFTSGLFITAAKKPLYIMHLNIPEFGTYDLNLMTEFTLNILNNESDLLPNFELRVVNGTTRNIRRLDEVGAIMKEFIDLISNEPIEMMILGPPFSNQAQVVAEVANFYNLVQVGYTTTAPYFSDKSSYPLFARTIEATLLHNAAIIKTLRKFNWSRVAKIVPTTDFVMAAAVDLQKKLDDMNFTTLASASYSAEITDQVQQLKDSGAKILIAFGTGGKESIFCKIYNLGMYGTRYQWIYWSGRHGLHVGDGGSYSDNCTKDMLIKASEGLIYFSPVAFELGISDQAIGPSGKTVGNITASYHEYVSRKPHSGKDFFPYIFDALWTMGIAINETIQRLGNEEAIESFSYADANTSRVLFEELTRVEFAGVTGPVAFDRSGDRMSQVVIGQLRNGQKVSVAMYDPVSDTISLIDGQNFVFHGAKPAIDYETVVVEEIKINNSLFSVITFLGVSGICMCVGCVVFNFYYRQIRYIKLSSPRINSMVAMGCCLCFISTILLGLHTVMKQKEDWLCQTRVAALVFGFSLAFGSMFSKTWRVHVLFTNKKLQKKVVKDIHLFGLVFVVFLVDCLILTLWFFIDPMRWHVIFLDKRFVTAHLEVIIQPTIFVCSSKYIHYWSGFFYGFKALLLLFGIFFAWETRKVQIEALNDSKHIGVCVYNVMIMSLLGVPIINLLSVNQVSIVYGIACLSILVCSLTTVILVFGVKMHTVWFRRNIVEDAGVMKFSASLRSTVQTAANSDQTRSGLERSVM